MDGKIYIGTSGWNYPHWRAPFYKGAPAKDFLSLYARRFRSVEVNKSFYRLLTPAEVKNWAAQTPPDFLFSLKGSRFITHMRRLTKPRLPLKRFFAPLKHLQKKFGSVLFQLPPRWDKNVERLKEFLDALPRGRRCAFEFRDPRWISDDVLDLLRKRKAGFCIYDFDGRASPRHVTAPFAYIRLHGPGRRYQGSYTEAELRGWAGWINGQRKAGVDVYCYFDNDQKAYAAKNAGRLAALLGIKPFIGSR